MTGRAGINLVLYPNLIIAGGGSFNVYEPVAVDRTVVHSYGVVFDNVPPEVNAIKARFLEDFAGFGYRDDNEIFERIQRSAQYHPGDGMARLQQGSRHGPRNPDRDGVIVGNVSDETGIRGCYLWWKELMSRDVQPRALV